MSESSAVEFDFLGLGGDSSLKKLSDRRDIQGVISKINPELLKTAIASASAHTSFVPNKAPMTIFFNGTILVYDVTPNQAENIMKLAESVNSVSKNAVESPLLVKPESNQNQGISRVLSNDLPMSRKRSLRRFLEKRKERHVAMSPYACSEGSTSWR